MILVGLHLALRCLSPQFAYARASVDRPLALASALLVAAGAVFVVGVCVGIAQARGGLRWILVAGLAMRGLMFGSTPVQEDDFYRYLWDGACTAHRANPYAYTPQEFQRADQADRWAPARLYELAAASGPVISRINHPQLRTIYPAVAQAAFALAYWLKPWSLDAWRGVLLLFDAATVALIVVLLRELRLPLVLANGRVTIEEELAW